MLAFSCLGQKLDAEIISVLWTKVKKAQYNLEQKLKISYIIMKYTLFLLAHREPQIVFNFRADKIRDNKAIQKSCFRQKFARNCAKISTEF